MAHGKNASVLFNKYDLSTYFNQADASGDQSTAESTGFQATSGSRTYDVGLNGGTASLSGFFNGAVGGVDERLAASINPSADDVVSISPTGVLTIGNIVKMLASQLTQYQVSSPVDGVVTVSGQMQSNGGIQTGKVQHALGAETVTGTSTSIDNAASSANGGVGHLHVTASSVGSHTIKIQHSVDDGVWVDLITFTGVTAATSQRSTVTGTVNQYTRSSHTIAGGSPTCTFMTAFARR